MLSILCVRLTIKVKVGIPESFKVGWYPPKKTGSSHLKARSRTTESENVWQQIADNLNSDHTLKFPSKKFVFFFFRETGVIAGSTNFSSNKRSLRYQSSKTSRLMALKHESITLSSLVRRALNPTCSILICFSREGGGVLAPGFLRSLYRRVQGILRSLMAA